MEAFILLLSPYAPHMAEELWFRLGHSSSLAYENFPEVLFLLIILIDCVSDRWMLYFHFGHKELRLNLI